MIEKGTRTRHLAGLLAPHFGCPEDPDLVSVDEGVRQAPWSSTSDVLQREVPVVKQCGGTDDTGKNATGRMVPQDDELLVEGGDVF